jgi:hypothetical protein
MKKKLQKWKRRKKRKKLRRKARNPHGLSTGIKRRT